MTQVAAQATRVQGSLDVGLADGSAHVDVCRSVAGQNRVRHERTRADANIEGASAATGRTGRVRTFAYPLSGEMRPQAIVRKIQQLRTILAR